MKKSILFLILTLFLFSCQKEELTPNNTNNQPIVVPIYTGPTTTPQTVVGQTWVITQYRVGQYGTILPLNDTLTFDNNLNYHSHEVFDCIYMSFVTLFILKLQQFLA